MQTFTVVYDDNNSDSITVQKTEHGAILEKTHLSGFSRFTFDDVTLTVEWKHAMGEGKVVFPDGLFYDMPLFCHLYQHISGGHVFCNDKVFENIPVLELFK